jgi:7-carboxy-7-deazaguanine synthase
MEPTLKITEIFTSIQGESTYSGLPCTFIRFTGCNLRCSYCDTKYAYEGGEEFTIFELLGRVKEERIALVEITGGEPLLQEGVYNLSEELINEGYTVLMETNGSMSIERLDRRLVKILDLKCPGSGMSEKMDFENLTFLEEKDQVKFVIGNREDYFWTKEIIGRYSLEKRAQVLLSPVTRKVAPKKLAEWILEDRLPVRFQLPLHKYIWGFNARGV